MRVTSSAALAWDTLEDVTWTSVSVSCTSGEYLRLCQAQALPFCFWLHLQWKSSLPPTAALCVEDLICGLLIAQLGLADFDPSFDVYQAGFL